VAPGTATRSAEFVREPRRRILPGAEGGNLGFRNVYADAARAEAYSRLEFPGTYYLAYRDLPTILAEHVAGRRALDFGCGAGRSTRFLRALSFDAIGVDIAEDMVRRAKELDPMGDYRLVSEDDLGLAGPAFDLVFSAFTFDNIPHAKKQPTFRRLASLLAPEGRLVSLVSTPDIYTHEWASFSTREFPENRAARSGDVVKIVMTDVTDRRPVEDVLCTDEAYREVYRAAGLEVVAERRPLAVDSEPFAWVNETRIAPWCVYVLRAV
jgi:SAM-dependent methyltransferase